MLGSALASFRPEGRGFIFLFSPGAEGSEGGLSPEGHLPLSAIPVLEARHSLPPVVFPPCGVWLGLCVGRVDPWPSASDKSFTT